MNYHNLQELRKKGICFLGVVTIFTIINGMEVEIELDCLVSKQGSENSSNIKNALNAKQEITQAPLEECESPFYLSDIQELNQSLGFLSLKYLAEHNEQKLIKKKANFKNVLSKFVHATLEKAAEMPFHSPHVRLPNHGSPQDVFIAARKEVLFDVLKQIEQNPYADFEKTVVVDEKSLPMCDEALEPQTYLCPAGSVSCGGIAIAGIVLNLPWIYPFMAGITSCSSALYCVGLTACISQQKKMYREQGFIRTLVDESYGDVLQAIRELKRPSQKRLRAASINYREKELNS